MNNWLFRILMIAIIGSFVLLSVFSAQKESLTFDEIFYIQEGITNVTTRTFPIDPYNPPLIRELSVLPTMLGFTSSQGVPNQIYFINRSVIILLGAILLWQVVSTTNEYFGQKAALLSGILLALEPTFLANSHYITPDIGVTLFCFLAYKAFLNILISPTLTRYFFFGIFLGLAGASKVSALPFLFVSLLVVFLIKRKTFPLEWHMDHIGSSVFSLFVAAFVIWGSYFFRMAPILVKQDNPNRVSNKILAFAKMNNLTILTQGIGMLQGTSVPLGDYIGILKNNFLRSRSGQLSFYMGVPNQPVRWYMIMNIIPIKLTIPFMLFIGLGLCLLLLPEKIIKYFVNTEDRLRNSQRQQELREQKEAEVMNEYKKVPRYKIRVQYDERMDKEWNYLFVIPIVSMVVVSIITGFSPLIRYMLPVFPFLAIVAGSSVQSLRSIWKTVVILLLLSWVGMETVSSFPHFISYANEFIPANKKYKYIVDSNLDWGQGLISMQEYYLREKPSELNFSYFGRDNAAWYDFFSDLPWGSYKNDEICQFHQVKNPAFTQPAITAISVTNWYSCGYYQTEQYSEKNIRSVVGDSILIF